MPAMYQWLAQECSSEALAIFAYTVYKQHKLVGKTLELRKRELEHDFFATKVGQQLEAVQTNQKAKRTWRGWATDVSANLAVNFATILVIASLLFGFRGLDQLLTEFGQHSGVLHK